ncbi:MAG: hypothetical protein IKH54_03635 [Bacilli bacterium]|nr:hypothetical protein [Bacilli bacterium]
MNNKIKLFLGVLLTLFSFYYTAKSIDLVKRIDPIMEKIEKNQDKFNISPIDARIVDDTIIPGLKGKQVNINLTYKKMKEYGMYNESLTILKDISPKVSIKNNYDKYIISGNKKKRSVSIIFYIDDIEKYRLITNYIDLEHIQSTLLIDSDLIDYLEEKDLTKNNIELNYKEINKVYVSSNSSYIENITNKKTSYCITINRNKKLLNVCKKYKYYTIIPSITLNNSPTATIKKELSNGSIILVEITNEIKKELDYIIYYIKSKGYDIISLNDLLKE